MGQVRVLHVFQRMRKGGAETLIMNVFREMDINRIHFDFLCMSNEAGEYDEEIRKRGGKIFIIESPKRQGVLNHIKDIISVIRNNGGYDVIHVPTMFHSGIVCLAAFLAGVKVRVVHSHNADEFNENTLYRKIYRWLSRILINLFCTDRMACGEKARDYLFGINSKVKNETLILNNGINLDYYEKLKYEEIYSLKNKLHLKKDTLILGNVARFEEQKNHIFFIKLGLYLKTNQIQAKIILVGDGKLKEEIERKIFEYNLNDYFLLLGVRNDIPELMSVFDVYVMPSLYEGFPLTIVEALAAGKNCVVSNTISEEINIIEKTVYFMDIHEEMDNWFKIICEAKEYPSNKNDNIKILKSLGFSSKDTASKLMDFYLTKGLNA